jgi:mannosyl-3-phosphoglycerate phosphatase
MTARKLKWLICTDLDASLLDGSYRWSGAESALRAIETAGIPLILNSSKTLAEMRFFATALDAKAPVIAENGTVLAFPEGLNFGSATGVMESGYAVERCGKSRDEILAVAHKLRETTEANFEGFSDMGAGDLVKSLGLDAEAAESALLRHGTEPILWRGSDAALESFAESLAAMNISLVRGGHFYHLMPSGQSKGTALKTVCAKYAAKESAFEWRTLAIGDSPNDSSMLETADHALVIPNLAQGTLKLERSDYMTANAPGPEGWGQAVLQFLKTNVGTV